RLGLENAVEDPHDVAGFLQHEQVVCADERHRGGKVQARYDFFDLKSRIDDRRRGEADRRPEEPCGEEDEGLHARALKYTKILAKGNAKSVMLRRIWDDCGKAISCRSSAKAFSPSSRRDRLSPGM